MTLRITLGLAVLAAAAVATGVAGTWNSAGKPGQASTPASSSAAIPDAFERAVNRAGTMPPDVVDRAIMRRQWVSRAAATPDVFERAVNRAGTMPPDVVDRAIMRRAAAESENSFRDPTPVVTPPGERIVDDWFREKDVLRVATETSPVDRIIAHEQGRIRDPRLYEGGSPAVIQVIGPGDGFDWADAGLGAGAGIAVVLLAAGGFALRRQMSYEATQS